MPAKCMTSTKGEERNVHVIIVATSRNTLSIFRIFDGLRSTRGPQLEAASIASGIRVPRVRAGFEGKLPSVLMPIFGW